MGVRIGFMAQLIFPGLLLMAVNGFSQSSIPLYETQVPNSIPTKDLYDTVPRKDPVSGEVQLYLVPKTVMPTLTVFEPPAGKATGIGVIVCSGGSYKGVADGVEGGPAARKLADAGITAFLLHYRVPRSDLMLKKEFGPLEDLQRAIQYVREQAGTFAIDPTHLGVMGFSAGGHLVSTIGTHLDSTYIENPKHTNLRPDFMILAYPVISFSDSLTHVDSRRNLIGPDILPEKIREYSNELQVTTWTPPTFLTHALDDTVVKIANSLCFAAALEQKKVPVQLFIYAKGGHGFGVYNKTADRQWIDSCIEWIKSAPWGGLSAGR